MDNKPNMFFQYIKQFPITSMLLAMNILMFIYTLATGGFTTENLYDLGGLVPYSVLEFHEYSRIITSMFLHGSFMHFFFNMYALFILGRSLEVVTGPYKFILISLVGGVGSAIAVVFFSPDVSLTIGASGMIFSIIGALLLLTFVRKRWFRPNAIKNIRFIVLLNIGITFIIPNISVAGHIGGLIMGALLMFVMVPDIPYFLKHRDNVL